MVGRQIQELFSYTAHQDDNDQYAAAFEFECMQIAKLQENNTGLCVPRISIRQTKPYKVTEPYPLQ